MKGRIVNYRRGLHTQHTNQFVVEVDGVESKEKAGTLLGRRVAYKTVTGKELVGSVSKVHGNNGAVLVRFEHGLPGQAIGASVEIS